MVGLTPQNNMHLLALTGSITIIALMIPLIAGGGIGGSEPGFAIEVTEFAFTVISNSTTQHDPYNVTADFEHDTLELIAGDGMIISVDNALDRITFNTTSGGGGGEINVGSNVGLGEGIYKTKSGVTLQFKSLTTTGDGIVLTGNTDDIELSLNNIPKSEIALAGTWVDADLPTNIIYQDGNLGGCADGQIMEWQTSNSTWICANDDTGGGGGSSGIAEPQSIMLMCGDAYLQGTNTAPKSTIDGANHDYVTCNFDTTVSETIEFVFVAPDNFNATANLDATVYFQVATGSAGVCFDVNFLDLASGNTVDSAFTGVQGACDSSTGTNALEVANIEFTSAQHSIDAGDVVFVQLSRDVADAGDTNTNDAKFIVMELKWNQ
jgi:hypothetical protein